MDEIRIHGRGGQGSVTLAHLLGEAAFEQGLWAQAFPAFGVERRGAPVEAFARIDSEQIVDRSQITEPTTVIVQDPTLLNFVDVTSGIENTGEMVINSQREPAELEIEASGAVYTLDATSIGREYLGTPIANTALLGAFAGVTGRLRLESVQEAITEEFPADIGEQNAAAASAAYQETVEMQGIAP